MAFTANPEDYTARGKIVTPLKDRIGSEIRTHYPETRSDAIAITRQEAWVARDAEAAAGDDTTVPLFVRETVEEIAFQARADKRIDGRSGVSQRLPITCLENVMSNAERRALASGERPVVARITDIYSALPSITGKLELEYEGELKGADQVALDLIRGAVRRAFDGWFDGVDATTVVEWFEMGGALSAGDMTPAADLLQQVAEIQGLDELLARAGSRPDDAPPSRAASPGARSARRAPAPRPPPRRAAAAAPARGWDPCLPADHTGGPGRSPACGGSRRVPAPRYPS
jgi:magnesium chelatase subunit I